MLNVGKYRVLIGFTHFGEQYCNSKRVVGRFLTWILLSWIFYGFFLPFGALFRRGRRDSMKRFYEPEALSYWSSCEPREAGLDFYKRQY